MIRTTSYAKVEAVKKNGFCPIIIFPQYLLAKHHNYAECTSLFPHSYMQGLNFKDLEREYKMRILKVLDPYELVTHLHRKHGSKIALVGFNEDPLRCHRRIVAEWLSAWKPGTEITEYDATKSNQFQLF